MWPAIAPTAAGSRRAPRRPACTGRRSPSGSRSSLLARLYWVLDRFEGRELHVSELAVDLLDLPQIDVVNDVARFGIDSERPARAFEAHSLHGPDQQVAVGLACGFPQHLVDEVHAVIGADADEVGAKAGIRRPERHHIILVGFGAMIGRIE